MDYLTRLKGKYEVYKIDIKAIKKSWKSIHPEDKSLIENRFNQKMAYMDQEIQKMETAIESNIDQAIEIDGFNASKEAFANTEKLGTRIEKLTEAKEQYRKYNDDFWGIDWTSVGRLFGEQYVGEKIDYMDQEIQKMETVLRDSIENFRSTVLAINSKISNDEYEAIKAGAGKESDTYKGIGEEVSSNSAEQEESDQFYKTTLDVMSSLRELDSYQPSMDQLRRVEHNLKRWVGHQPNIKDSHLGRGEEWTSVPKTAERLAKKHTDECFEDYYKAMKSVPVGSPSYKQLSSRPTEEGYYREVAKRVYSNRIVDELKLGKQAIDVEFDSLHSNEIHDLAAVIRTEEGILDEA